MGRIADSALDLLAAGPLTADEIGAALARDGVTRSRAPGAAVRRALAGDARVIRTGDGRLASVTQALAGVELTVAVDAEDVAAGEVPIDPDLAPLGFSAWVRRCPCRPGSRPATC